MLDSTIGEHSRKSIENLVKVYHQEDNEQRKRAFLSHKEQFAYLCSIIGDEYLSKTASRMYNEMRAMYQPHDDVKEQIQWHKQRIIELEASQHQDD